MTLCFPQLSTGTSGQFPIRKTLVRRTVVNRLLDGTQIRLPDPDAAAIEWSLEYHALNDAERAALAEFFDQARGRLRSFLFLDPCGNLLTYSEDFERSAWDVDGMVRVEANDGFTTLVNTAQSPQQVRQTVAAPGWYRFCGSGLFRAPEAGLVRVLHSNADGSIASERSIGEAWSEISCSGSIEGEAEEITLAIEIPSGLALDVRGLQLEAQPARSGYRRTTAVGGLFPETRFDQDELEFVSEGIENHSTSIRLVSRMRL